MSKSSNQFSKPLIERCPCRRIFRDWSSLTFPRKIPLLWVVAVVVVAAVVVAAVVVAAVVVAAVVVAAVVVAFRRRLWSSQLVARLVDSGRPRCSQW